MDKLSAKQECSKHGSSVHLPIPRFAEENELYRKHFGKQAIWLDISYEDSDGLKSVSGHSFTYLLQTSMVEFMDINEYKWMKFDSTNKFDYHEVVLTKSGQWMLKDENEPIDSICVYNIIPDQSCLTCADKDFCRFNKKETLTIECVCPYMKGGDFCEIDLCQTHCQNNGKCQYNENTKAIDCRCEYPFHGEKCEKKSKYTGYMG